MSLIATSVVPENFDRDISVSVGLVQINNSFSGQNYLPYSLACLRSYVENHAIFPSRYTFLPMIYKRMPIEQIVNSMESANVVGFSTYVWNAEISLETARRIKNRNPKTLIVFGGPQVPDKAETFLREHPFVDVVVHNEGEKTFLKILELYPDKIWDEVAGISFIAGDGSFRKTHPVDRMKNLEELPSPFLNGVLDQLIEQNPEEKWIGLWETNRGCPFKCTFCDWGSATAAKVRNFEVERLERELEWFVDKKVEYIFVCDANFGILKRDIEIAEKVAGLRRSTGYPQGFSVQSTKNATDRAYLTQKVLADAGLNKGVALSMQSLDPTALENIKRDNISLDTYLDLSQRFASDGIETYSDLILGLPGETYGSYVDGIETLIKSGQHNRIQFNNLSILPNAEMGDPDYLAKFQMKTVRSDILNIHGSREYLDDDVAEMQDVVVSTYSMSSCDWRQARAISWMIAFLYFDKLFQIPILMLGELKGISYKEIFERFMAVQAVDFPNLSEIRDFFLAEAESIQNGGPEYVYSEDWLGIYWPADEYIFIKYAAEQRFDELYDEVHRLLLQFSQDEFLEEAILVNRELVSRPGLPNDLTIKLKFNVIDVWRCICQGKPYNLVRGEYTYNILRSKRYYDDFERWCREIVWWGNKKGAYLYPIEESFRLGQESYREIAGHY
jgi:radical SAM superfamily enzyme YgiQ (UPF0313 family)